METAAERARRTAIAESAEHVTVSPPPEITWRVHFYPMAADLEVGRAALTKTLEKVVPDVYSMCDGGQGGTK